MFACLQVLPPEPRMRQWRRAQPPEMIRVETPSGAPFFLLETRRRRGEVPWNAVERAAGRCRSRMLFPEGVVPPLPPEAVSAAAARLEPGIRAFCPKRLPLVLCLRAAQQVMRRSEIPAQKLSLTLVDRKGLLSRSLEPLVMLAGSLRVFTPDPGAYRGAAQQLLSRYGVTLILSESVGCFANSDVVVADDLSLFTGREKGLIFTPDQRELPGCRVVRGRLPQLTPAFEPLLPRGIDPLLFAAALYELCAAKEMERLQFGGFQVGLSKELYSIEDLAGMLRPLPGILR
ncbi:MAG: hypothetical protein FWH26_04635 [Oscillospiraceae bacterium]|nr:hypothetical protein [Oscillospiraceae bacterium]